MGIVGYSHMGTGFIHIIYHIKAFQKKFLLMQFLLIFSVFVVHSQLQKGMYRLSASVHRGFIADEGNDYNHIIKGYVHPFKLNISRRVTGNKEWHHIYNFPEQGIQLGFHPLGNKKELGTLMTLMPYIDFPLLLNNKLQLKLFSGLGAAYVTRKFDPEGNYKNTFFSKPLNFAFEFDVTINYRMADNFQVFAGPSYLHASNGETKIPNDGMNIISFFAGGKYLFGKTGYPEAGISFSENHLNHISVYGTLGYREVIPYGGDDYLASGITLEYSRRINKKQQIGTGMSYFYDASYTVWTKHNLEPVQKNAEATFGGIFISHEFILHPLYIVFHMGSYLFNRGLLEDVKYYNRIGIKYYILPSLFLSFTHKSHFFFYGDNLEWGLGYRFKL